ncbi:hypothetical protein DL767_007884 [Monosporascus sp. MG133]|nr:hypothetical protein DL767_007884 [Monosporascus sp. MG133]
MLRRAAIPGLWAGLSSYAVKERKPGVTVPRSLASTIDRVIQAWSGFHGLLVRKGDGLDEDSVVRHEHFVKILEKDIPDTAPNPSEKANRFEFLEVYEIPLEVGQGSPADYGSPSTGSTGEKANEAWAGCCYGTYDLVAGSVMANTGVDFLQAAEAKVEACTASTATGHSGAHIFPRNYHALFMKAQPRPEKDEYERTEEDKAILHGVFQELVFKGQIADDPVEDELSRGSRLFVGPASKGMHFWLVFATPCPFEAHRVLCPELHRPFEQLQPYARLIRGNIQVNLNIRQPCPYRRETLGTVRDTIDEWIFSDQLATMPNRPPGRGPVSPSCCSRTTRSSAASCCTGCGRRSTASGCPSATRGADAFLVGGEPPPLRVPGDAAPQLRALAEVHQHAQETRGREGPAHDGEREEAQGASIRLPHLAGAVPVGPHPPRGRRRGQDRRSQHEEHEGASASRRPRRRGRTPSSSSSDSRPAELLLQKLLVALDADTAGHPYLSVGTPPKLDVVSDNTAFRLDDNDPVTRAERKRATVAAVEGLLGRGAWGSYINELLVKSVVGRGMPGCAE